VRRPTLIALVLVVVAAGACGGGSSGSSSTTSTSGKTSSKQSSGKGSGKGSSKPTTTSTTRNPLAVEGNNGPGCRFIVAGTAKRFEQPEPNAVVQYLTDAVATPTGCYDKVTFTFDKGDADGLQAPGYLVEYRKKPYGLVGVDGKPLNTSTAGFRDAKAVLYVEMTPAATMDLRNPGRPITTWNRFLRLPFKHMKHVVIVEWPQKLPPDATPTDPNDDKVIWLIGLDKKRPFTVDYATQPVPHISVLIMH
jgi:hypothetical protein